MILAQLMESLIWMNPVDDNNKLKLMKLSSSFYFAYMLTKQIKNQLIVGHFEQITTFIQIKDYVD